jgi:hypothetical protein
MPTNFLAVKIYINPYIAVRRLNRDTKQEIKYTDIDRDEMNFCVSVLASLGGGHVNDFARSALNNDMSIFPIEKKV